MNIYEPYIQIEEKPHHGKFIPRPEQKEAIDKTFKYFSKNKEKGAEFLWNAKMRFGKTVSALWLIERLYKELGKKKVLIITHRPVVNASWYGDFKNIFQDNLSQYSYGTARETDAEIQFKDFYAIKKDAEQNGKCVVFFASMQYLRLAKIIRGAGQDESKIKEDILNFDWDLVIIDEAHEGTQTDLGEGVISYLKKSKTFMLSLSGTPFNLIEKFKGDQIYNWDYIKEQQTKRKWDEDHKRKKNIFDETEVNPYRELPQMVIMTFRIGEMTDEEAIKDLATGKFSFAEFFRVKMGHDVPKEERGTFVHEREILQFLMTMWKPETGYPFSSDEYRRFFRHTLWVVPGVKEAKALKTLIETKTPLPKWGFKVVNVAGNSEDDEQKSNALDKVFKAMKVDPQTGADDSDQSMTITLSCARLTTGVTVKPWTAVLYMKGSETTNASTYMQTIFRVQSPHVLHGMMKNKCYVFDFAPERALVMMAETAKYSRAFEKKDGKKEKKQKSVIDQEDKEKMKQLLAECPVIETKNGSPIFVNGVMKPVACEQIFSQLTSVYVDKVVRNGFDHPSLYNYNEFLKLELEDEMNLNYISGIFDDTPSNQNDSDGKKIDVNHQDYTPEQLAALEAEKAEREKEAKKAREDAKKKYADKLAEMTPEQREQFLKEKEENARKLKLIHQSKDKLTGLSKRIPLMMYGANVKDFEEVTLDNFTDKRFIDDDSWNEFMPNGVTRQLFRKLTKFYNPDVFKDAGIRIRQLAREADSMKVEERIARIAQIFKWFKNPDKETVLTPWEVVNRHMSSTLGGYFFFEDDFKTPVIKVDKETGDIVSTNEPRFIDQGEVTKEVFGDGSLGNIDELQGKINTKILEINSKTGLYPLYVAYSLYRHLLPVYANEKGLMADNPEDYSAEDEHVIWDEVVSNNLYVICNTKMAERITRRTLLGFRTQSDGKEIKLHVKQDRLIKRAKEDREKLIEDLLCEGYWMNSKMKGKNLVFNAVVGNPPYQEEGLNTRKPPIYHYFYDLAFDLSEKVTLITPGRFLFKAGQTPKDWMNKMLNDVHFKVVDYFPKSDEVFSSVDIKGGIAITYRDSNKNFGKINFFSSYSELRSILKKVTNTPTFKYGEFSELISSRGMYRFEDIFFKEYPKASLLVKKGTGNMITSNSFELYNEVFHEVKPNDGNQYIQLYGRIDNKREYRWINQSYLMNNEYINFYNVFVPEANGTGAIGEVLSTPIIGTPIIGTPMLGHTDTFLSIGQFESEQEAENCLKYICTKFARTMLGTLKATQHNPRDTWANVPLQDFTSASDIDWSQSIPDIDKQLYKKYGLSSDEVAFIESKIKPMD